MRALLRRRWARWTGVAGVVAVVVGALAVWGPWGRDHERSVEDTLHAFFTARADADCDALVELLSEASWSDGGRLSRRQFLRRCPAAVDEYRPDLVGVEVVSEDRDRAVVNLSVRSDPALRPERQDGVLVRTDERATLAYELGQLVREDGVWKVEADQGLLRIGRSVEQTVRGFVDLFNDDDCERLVDLLTDDVWSAGGRLSREEYVDRCLDAAEVRPYHVPELGVPETVEVTFHPDQAGTATARWHPVSVGELFDAGPSSDPPETVTLVREGLEWKLGSLPETVARLELQGRLLAKPPSPAVLDVGGDQVGAVSGEPSFEVGYDQGTDARERQAEDGLVRDATVTFTASDDDTLVRLDLILYEFEASEGALRHAERLAQRLGQRSSPRSPAPVPSVADVRAAVRDCTGSSEGACERGGTAVGVAVAGRFLTAAWLYDDRYPAVGDLTLRVEEVLHAQLDRL